MDQHPVCLPAYLPPGTVICQLGGAAWPHCCSCLVVNPARMHLVASLVFSIEVFNSPL